MIEVINFEQLKYMINNTQDELILKIIETFTQYNLYAVNGALVFKAIIDKGANNQEQIDFEMNYKKRFSI